MPFNRTIKEKLKLLVNFQPDHAYIGNSMSTSKRRGLCESTSPQSDCYNHNQAHTSVDMDAVVSGVDSDTATDPDDAQQPRVACTDELRTCLRHVQPQESRHSLPDVANNQARDANSVNCFEAEQHTFESIPAEFFQCTDLDQICRQQLSMFSVGTDVNEIHQRRKIMRAQLLSVSTRLSALITKMAPAHEKELEKIMNINKKLETALSTSLSLKSSLDSTRGHMIDGVLTIFTLVRHKYSLLQSINTLCCIQHLKQLDSTDLDRYLCEDRYEECVRRILDFLGRAEQLRVFVCVQQLISRLQSHLRLVEERMYARVQSMCVNYDSDIFARICSTHALLDTRSCAEWQMEVAKRVAHTLRHWAAAAFTGAPPSEVYEYPNSKCDQPRESDYCENFKQIIQSTPSSMLAHYLKTACAYIWRILYNVNLMLSYMKAHYAKDETNVVEYYARIRNIVWCEVEAILSDILLCSQFLQIIFVDYIFSLQLILGMRRVGSDFIGSNANTQHLVDVCSQLSLQYMRVLHQSCFDRLSNCVEHELWQISPVDEGFTLFHMSEFKCLYDVRMNWFLAICNSYSPVTCYHGNNHTSAVSLVDCSTCNLFDLFDANTFPLETGNVANGVVSDDTDSNIDLESISGQKRQHCRPITSTTSLEILRMAINYARVIIVFGALSDVVFARISQLLDYYIYSVCSMFALQNGTVSSQLQDILTRIAANFFDKAIANNSVSNGIDASRVSDLHVTVPQMVLEFDSDFQEVLSARIVAAESVVFLADELKLLSLYLEKHCVNSFISLHNYCDKVLEVCRYDMRVCVYEAAVCRCVDRSTVLALMSEVSWSIGELRSQHNGYVDVMIKNFQSFCDTIKELKYRLDLQTSVTNIFWSLCASKYCRLLLEGFGRIRDCTFEGRALMQLDLQHFAMKFEKLSQCAGSMDRERNLVDVYIKAFYVPEDDLQQWIMQHTEYSKEHCISLITCMIGLSKQTKSKLISSIESDESRINT